MRGTPSLGHLQSVGMSNPLGLTLAHYQRELTETLRRCGAKPVSLESRVVEGERGAVGKVRMLGRALDNATKVARSECDLNLCLWPSLGLYELALHGTFSRNTAVVLHDPDPITREFGYDRVAKLLTRRRTAGRLPAVVVHSEEAAVDARALAPRARIVLLPHPVAEVPRNRATAVGMPSALVAGQYKPTRNIDLLNRMGPLLRAQGIEPLLVGRGWTGKVNDSWRVDDRFVPEAELDAIMASSAAVVIPYRRYYQSGVAVRALELGTLPVGESNSFMRMLIGERALTPGADADTYVRAVCELVEAGPEAARSARAAYQDQVDGQWAQFLEIAQ